MSENGRKKILFDLDDTILDFHTAERHALRAAFDELGIDADEKLLRRYSEINAFCWQQLELGRMTREEVLVSRFEKLFREKGIDCDARTAQERYEGFLENGHFFVPGAEELLEALYPKYDLYLVSNGNTVTQESRLKSAGIGPYFKKIFISEQIGVNKPERAFFEACFSEIPDFHAEDAVIVGDSLTSDIRGGINAGIRTCWFNPAHKPVRDDIKADYIFHALGELPALLETIFA